MYSREKNGLCLKTGPLKHQHLLPIALTLLVLMLLGGCAGSNALRLPPVTQNPTGQYQTGSFVWFDLLTEDLPAAKEFYSLLFGWKIDSPRDYPGYFVILHNGKAIGGMAAHENRDAKTPESLWLPSLSVDDVDAAIKRTTENGGKLVDGPLTARGRGRVALILDPEGVFLFLLRSAGGDPALGPASAGAWVWVDLITQDAASAGDFYVPMAGYQAEIVETGGGRSYHILKRDGRMRAGIVELKWKGLKDNWLPYVKVDQVGPMIEKARKLGAKLILQVDDMAILADPTGAAFGIQKS